MVQCPVNPLAARLLGVFALLLYDGTLAILLAVVMALMVSGCTINTRAGSMPKIEALEDSLKLGQSTEKEVLDILGKPFGKGNEMLPFHEEPRMMWTYYYEEGNVSPLWEVDDHRIFLFVFFRQGRYDGYMWFSSLEPHRAILN